MLAAEKSRHPHAALALDAERQQQQRRPILVIGDDNERLDAFALADLALPGLKKIKTLIRREKLAGLFKTAPDGFRRTHVAEKFDAGNAACLRPRLRSHPALHHGRHGHPHYLTFESLPPFFGFGATLAKKCQQRVMTMRPRRGGNRG